ncbi:hypothetical protein ACFLT7_01430 [candidate division KSB1 bacterium]
MLLRFYSVFVVFWHLYVFFFEWGTWYEPLAPVYVTVIRDIVWIIFILISVVIYFTNREFYSFRDRYDPYNRLFKYVFFGLAYLYVIVVFVHLTHKSYFDILQHELRNTLMYSLIILLYPIWIRNNEDLSKLIRIILYSGVAAALFGIATGLFMPDLTWRGRVISTLENPNTLGFFMNMIMFITLSLLLSGVLSKKWWIAFALFLFCLVMTFSFQNYIACVLGLVMVFVIKRKWKSLIDIPSVLLFIAAVVMVYISSGYADTLFIRLRHLLPVAGFQQGAAFSRIEQFTQFLGFIADSSVVSLLFGDFSLVRYARYDSQYYNFFINNGFLVPSMIFVYFAFIALLGYIKYVRLAKKRDRTNAAIVLGSGLTLMVALVVQFFFTAFLNRFPLNFFFYLNMAIIIYMKTDTGEGEKGGGGG